MAQQHHGYVHPAPFSLHRLGRQGHRIFLVNIDVVIIRHHAQHGNAAELFQYFHARLKQADVATELINQNALHALAFLGSEQEQRTVDARHHAAPVDIAHQYHIGVGMQGHRHIHQVDIAKVHLGQAAGPFEHHRIKTSGQAVEGGMHFVPQHLTPLFAKIAVSILMAHRPTVQDHLSRSVALRFKEQRVHVGMTSHAGRLGLHRLSPPNLQPLGSGIRIERHILGLERSRAKAVLLKNSAKSRCNNAFPHIAACSGKHNGM